MDFQPEDQPYWNNGPDDRFLIWIITLVLAVIVCGAIALWVV